MSKKLTLEVEQKENVEEITTTLNAVGFSRIEIVDLISDFLIEYTQKSRKYTTELVKEKEND
ncbi:MAG: hypothetical protein WC827_03860 [Candidatus Paceibacterota bacterium]|jgi:hypothetical protein